MNLVKNGKNAFKFQLMIMRRDVNATQTEFHFVMRLSEIANDSKTNETESNGRTNCGPKVFFFEMKVILVQRFM